MDVRVHGKNMQVAESVRALATDKVLHAARILDVISAADVEFVEEHNPRIAARFLVEITSRAHGHTVRAQGTAHDDRSALDIAIDRFERQLRKLKERMIQRSRKATNKQLNPRDIATDEEGDEGPRIVRNKRFAMRPMTPEEAALEMEMLGHDFFFFLDASSGMHCVLYHRRDGSLGLIEPE
ncbi:MAG: ribosome hibernation-promoting factor, HPF/YfiA family [Acidimicrobiia bacterium]